MTNTAGTLVGERRCSVSVVGPVVLVVAGIGALLLAARVVMLVTGDARDEQVGRALTAHGACCLVFVVVAVLTDPLSLPAPLEVPLAIMAAAWGAAWVVIGRAYGLRFGAPAPRREPASGRAARSRAAREPHRRGSARSRP